WKLSRAGLMMEWKVRDGARGATAWFPVMKEMATIHTFDSLQDLTPTELLDRLDQLDHRFRGRDVTFAIVAGVSQGLQALRFLMKRWMGPDWHALLNTALQRLGNVVSGRQVLWLAGLGEDAREGPKGEACLV